MWIFYCTQNNQIKKFYIPENYYDVPNLGFKCMSNNWLRYAMIKFRNLD